MWLQVLNILLYFYFINEREMKGVFGSEMMKLSELLFLGCPVPLFGGRSEAGGLSALLKKADQVVADLKKVAPSSSCGTGGEGGVVAAVPAVAVDLGSGVQKLVGVHVVDGEVLQRDEQDSGLDAGDAGITFLLEFWYF